MKKGVRYRYYISSAILHKRGTAGSVSRVPATEIEDLVMRALRPDGTQKEFVPADVAERALTRLNRVIITPEAVQIHIARTAEAEAEAEAEEDGEEMEIVSVPWTQQTFVSVKGVSKGQPVDAMPLKAETRDALLAAIANAHAWMQDLVAGCTTIEKIAELEGKGERSIRLLLPLAFTAPSLVSKIANGHVSPGITVTNLSAILPNSWAAQIRGRGDG